MLPRTDKPTGISCHPRLHACRLGFLENIAPSAVDVSSFASREKRETSAIAWEAMLFDIRKLSAVDWTYIVRNPWGGGEACFIPGSTPGLTCPAVRSLLPLVFYFSRTNSWSPQVAKCIFSFSIKGSAVVKLEPRQAGKMPSNLRGWMDRVYSAPKSAMA